MLLLNRYDPMTTKLSKKTRAYQSPVLAFTHDILMSYLAFGLALYLRIGDKIDQYLTKDIGISFAIFLFVSGSSFLAFRLYRGVWRYASILDLFNILKAVTAISICFITLSFFVTRIEDVPRSVPLICWFIQLSLLGGPRLIYRLIKDRKIYGLMDYTGLEREKVLLIGAGDEAELFIRMMRNDPHGKYHVIGIIDEKDRRTGRYIHDIKVLGAVADIPHILQDLSTAPTRFILSRPYSNTERGILENIVKIATDHEITISRLPNINSLQDAGPNSKLNLHPIAIEDLLGRPETKLNREKIEKLILDRKVLITGSGGSIGSELSRQIAQLAPSELTLIDNCEFNLYKIDLEIRQKHPKLILHTIMADVRDRVRIDEIFNHHQPQLVFHAAALKHVPVAEDNIQEAVKTNIIGTRNIADMAQKYHAMAMVQISTDKAVNPANVMGATKRIAEAYAQALDLDGAEKEGPNNGRATRFMTVRFGNVLGSTGSVVPLFKKQLEAGGPLTVTHPDITRFFMTIKEAVELVLQASAYGQETRGERGKIFVLDMGEPVKIVDLAYQLIRLAGFRPHEDIKVEFTGLRPGEKLYEELFANSEPPVPSGADGVLLANPRAITTETLRPLFTEMENAVSRTATEPELLKLIKKVVPEFRSKGLE